MVFLNVTKSSAHQHPVTTLAQKLPRNPLALKLFFLPLSTSFALPQLSDLKKCVLYRQHQHLYPSKFKNFTLGAITRGVE